MQLPRRTARPAWIGAGSLVIGFAIAILAVAQPPAGPTSHFRYPTSYAQQPATSTVYVPLVLRNWPAATHTPAVVFGTQFAPFQEEDAARLAEVVAHDLALARRAGFTSIRTHVYWRRVEPFNIPPEAFNWYVYDQRLRAYRNHGLDPVVSIVGYPGWATRYACGGGLVEGMAPEWREFVRALAGRYSAAPYNVHIWEIGNEVDGETEVDPEEDGQRPPPAGGGEPTWPFGGCWGDMAAEYVDFLRIAYEEIKAVNPDATVMPGGLAYTEFERWFIRDFFESFLAAGGADYSDVIGFHWFKGFQVWPTAVAKAGELREIMARYGVDRPLWLTETYMPDRVLETDTRQERYEFITQELPRTLGSGEIERVYWYGFSDWPEGWSDIDRGLVSRDHVPKAGLKVFEIMTEFVSGRPAAAALPGVEAYRFSRTWAGDENWVLWSTTGLTQTVALPALGVDPAAVRIAMGTTYATTGPALVNLTWQPGEIRIPVGPDTVFVRIRTR